MSQDNLEIFSEMERDAIGEIMNISIGTSATAVSNMLQKRTDITTPRVEVVTAEEFEITSMEPAVGVEIEYVQGIEGNNIFVLKRVDVHAIVETLMQTSIPIEEFELDELYMSAVCEVMNQMMGAASTALATLLGEPVNISTPVAYEVDSIDDLKSRYFREEESIVVVRFNLKIEDILDSEFLSVMPIDLAKRVVAMFSMGGEEEDEEIFSIMSESTPTPAPEQVPEPVQPAPQPMQQPTMQEQPMQQQMQQPVQQPMMQQQPMQQQMQQQPMMQPQMQQPMMQQQPQMGYPQQQMDYGMMQQQPQYGMPMQQMPYGAPRLINVQSMSGEVFNHMPSNLPEDQGKNLDMLMSVPLEISVQIGRARKQIKEIVAFTQGTLVVLDKLAGEQVDLYVNDQCIAKGDVVVVDDSFGVRITKILDRNDIFKIK